jgi:hypothetical protein
VLKARVSGEDCAHLLSMVRLTHLSSNHPSSKSLHTLSPHSFSLPSTVLEHTSRFAKRKELRSPVKRYAPAKEDYPLMIMHSIVVTLNRIMYSHIPRSICSFGYLPERGSDCRIYIDGMYVFEDKQ